MIRSTPNVDRQQTLPGMAAPVIPPSKGNATSFSDALTSLSSDSTTKEEPLREAFQDFVGQTLFGQMLSSMRSTVGKPAYFHGGRGEEVFQEQLDALLVEEISEASASSVADPMFELFQMQRSQ
jgi:peptidoglycan hydrolase FlgJ